MSSLYIIKPLKYPQWVINDDDMVFSYSLEYVVYIICFCSFLGWGRRGGESQIVLNKMEDVLLISFKGFGRRKDIKTLRSCVVLAVIRCIQMERNNKNLRDCNISKLLLWDRIVFFASLWCSLFGAFRGASLADIQRDWGAVLT